MRCSKVQFTGAGRHLPISLDTSGFLVAIVLSDGIYFLINILGDISSVPRDTPALNGAALSFVC